jgi:WD40 repeat protein
VIRRTIVAAALAVPAVLAPPAHAAGNTLPLTDFGDLVVDQTHKRVFVTGGASNNSVVVTDLSGRVQKVLSDQYGATGLALSADNNTLYVGLASGDAVALIDTAKLTETARYPTGPQTCPTHLTRVDSVVWFGYGCDDVWNGRVGKLDAGVVSLDQQGGARFQKAPVVSSSGVSPLVAGQLELSLSNVHVFTVQNGTLTPGASGGGVGSNLTDISLSPDGSTLFTAAGSRDAVDGFATSDLARRGGYTTGPYPNAVAASPDGQYIATGIHTTADDVAIYRPGGTLPVDTFSLPGTSTARGLAWSPDRKRLFAVSHEAPGNAPILTVLDP